MPRDSSDTTRYRMTVQYLGSRFSGWQTQPKRTTIQATLEEALSRLAGRPVSVRGASRTDSGVHARGQVAHLQFPHRESIPDLQKALNALLPRDVQVRSLGPASSDFHAQKSARRKRYQYRIYNGQVLSPFLHGRVCHVRHRLDLEAMQEAARVLAGRHDFSSFAAASTTVRSRVRTIFASRLRTDGRSITYTVEADGFLHHMVRNIVGTLIEVGLGRRPADGMAALLEAHDRTLAGPTAPPEGLWLIRIWY